MRRNIFQYHVQNRDYYRSEIISLINEAPNKHLLLSGSQFFYSTGTIAESIGHALWPIKAAVSFIGSTVYSIGQGVITGLGINYFSGGVVSSGIVINNNYITNNSLYKITDIPNDKFTGREITKFMSDYYDYSPHWNNDVYYGNIVSKFLNHDYLDAEVSTLGNSHWFPVAVLDTY